MEGYFSSVTFTSPILIDDHPRLHYSRKAWWVMQLERSGEAVPMFFLYSQTSHA